MSYDDGFDAWEEWRESDEAYAPIYCKMHKGPTDDCPHDDYYDYECEKYWTNKWPNKKKERDELL